ncbi:hypothetical protein COB72_07115 [bacterium]|nr:MAG: hypothetical protein COB72_07115 [bacterium]
MNAQNAHADVFRTRVYAKVNLVLGVGPRDDLNGLHPICSWMHAIDVCDKIEIRKVPEQQESEYVVVWAQGDGSVVPVEWAIADDLGVRAHKVVEEYVGRQLAISLRVLKSIPAGGGLGGGSADAAGVLMGINELFSLKLGHQTLVKLAMKLGSDIPFFLDPGRSVPRPAIVEGFGDQITRLDSGHAGTLITLIMPAFGCHTGKVYRVFDAMVGSEHTLDKDRVVQLASQRLRDESALFNDLAKPACTVVPELNEVRDAFEKATGRVIHVSGSGSTLFVIGEIDPRLIKQACPNCSVVKTQLC